VWQKDELANHEAHNMPFICYKVYVEVWETVWNPIYNYAIYSHVVAVYIVAVYKYPGRLSKLVVYLWGLVSKTGCEWTLMLMRQFFRGEREKNHSIESLDTQGMQTPLYQELISMSFSSKKFWKFFSF